MQLKKLRAMIDVIDEKILKLLNERAKQVVKVGKLKNKKNLATYSPEREASMLARLKKINKGPFKSKDIENVFSEILSISRAQRSVLKIAYLGPETTFTHIAALKKFGRASNYIECKSIADVFAEVDHARADYGVVPIENSTEGAINHTLDMFVDSELKICSEVYLSINHNLVSKVSSLSQVKRVVSHPQVFAQCRIWLENNFPGVEIVQVQSTSLAAYRLAHPKDPKLAIKPIKGEAAIASGLAAEKYKLNVLARSIEDSPHNITRFLIIGKCDAMPTKNDKTSIVFSMKDKTGALHDVLVPFKRDKINLTKIESRPSKEKAWKYYFFVDMQGHRDSSSIQKALSILEKECIFVKTLGSYPKES